LSAWTSLCLAVAPKWYDGPCGISKYSDAGDMPLAPPAAERNGVRIINGIAARPYEFPWQIEMLIGGVFWCSGSIINDRWIASAAHCVVAGESNPSSLSVVIGQYKRGEATPTRRVIQAARCVRHEQFNSYSLQNDIGLVELTEPIEFSEDVQPICAPDPDLTYEWLAAVVAGWGIVTSEGPAPWLLQYITMNVTTNDYCAQRMSVPGYGIYPEMICAVDSSDRKGSDYRRPCFGDSGGPMAVKDPQTKAFSLIGVDSFAVKLNNTDCVPDFPAGFSRVGNFSAWILKTIGRA